MTPPSNPDTSPAEVPGSGEGTPDEVLMARIAQGEMLAFEALYARHGRSVLRFLQRCCGQRTWAEDLTQDVFLKVFRAAPRWRPEAPLRAWIFQIARRHWWNASAWHRRRRQVLGSQAPPPDVAAPQTGALARVQRAEAARQVEAAVQSLPRGLRLVFVLVRLEGLSLKDAALVADIPVGTVKSRIATAEKRLRRTLARERPSRSDRSS